MNCKELKKYTIDYLLGELDPILEMRVNEHLLGCKKCQQEIVETEKLLEAVKDEKEYLPGKRIYQKIKKSIRMGKRFNPFSFLNRPVKLYYAVATFLIGIFLMSLTNIFIENNEVQPKGIKTKYKAINESPPTDSIAFYAAPSHRLGGT